MLMGESIDAVKLDCCHLKDRAGAANMQNVESTNLHDPRVSVELAAKAPDQRHIEMDGR